LNPGGTSQNEKSKAFQERLVMADITETRSLRTCRRATITALAALAVFGVAVANAQQLSIATYAQIGSNYIDFGQYATGAPYAPAPGYGTFTVINVGGLFSLEGVTTGESGSIQSLNEAAGIPSTPLITFSSGGSNLSLDASTVGPLAVNGGFFGSIVSFEITGTVSSSTTGTLGDFILRCSADIFGVSPTDLLASLAAGTPVETSLSCTAAVIQTPQQETETIIDAVNALYSDPALNRGQDNSLVVKLQHAIVNMNAENNTAAIDNLNSFVGEVNDLLSSGVLSSSQAAPLISAAQGVIARLSP
jgi:hypothetical protein